MLPFHRSPPGPVFVPGPEGKAVKDRLHIDLAPHTSHDRDAGIARLLERGATRTEVGQIAEHTWDALPGILTRLAPTSADRGDVAPTG